MHDDPTALLRQACHDADSYAADVARGGQVVVRTIGGDVPTALLRACGLAPVMLAPCREASATLPPVVLDQAGRQLLAAVLALPPGPLVVATNEPAGAMLFAVLRELMRCGDLATRPLHGVDLLRPRDEATVHYNRARLDELTAWAAGLGGRMPRSEDLQAACAVEARQLALLAKLDGWRRHEEAQLSGTDWLNAACAADVLLPDVHLLALHGLLDRLPATAALRGERVFVAGAEPRVDAVFRALEACGLVIVADDLGFCSRLGSPAATEADPWMALARRQVQPGAASPLERACWTVEHAKHAGVARLLHVGVAGDEAQPWVRRWLEVACTEADLTLCPIDLRPGEQVDAVVRTSLLRVAAPPARQATTVAPASAKPSAAPRANAAPAEGRSRKSLQAVADFGRYQRDWFQGVRARTLGGELFAVVNADAPQEILRAFDIPFVVNQWWASIVAAKQQSRRYLALLRGQGYPTDAEPYSAQGLAAFFDTEADQAPWGGLPHPQWLLAFTGSAATRGIFSSWAAATGAELCLFDRTVDTRVELPPAWWDRLPCEWDELLEKPRLDLIESEFGAVIERLERSSGRRFDKRRFAEVMDLVNEQEEFYRRTRDLIAGCAKAPVGIVDTMPATMVPQWHRGTAWGRDAARALYDEVQARAAQGLAACPDERVRLMWVGRGLWSDMGFYQRWEASHGAVFVWSMYLALAADGYLRYCRAGQSPLRALAARFITMGDELRMPTWAGAWHVHEARTHRVDAAVAIDDADPLVLRALERAGIPVLRLALNNFAGGAAGLDDAARQVDAFLGRLASPSRGPGTSSIIGEPPC